MQRISPALFIGLMTLARLHRTSGGFFSSDFIRRVTPILSYRNDGRKRLMSLGYYGVLTLHEARNLAQHMGYPRGDA